MNGQPGDQVRQGAGGITLHVVGTNLSAIDTASVGNFPATVVPGSDTDLDLQVTIDHGAALGFLDVQVSGPDGSATSQNAIEITTIHAVPTGDDAAAGTTEAPFKTLTQALLGSGDGDIIDLGQGVFDESSGEVWPDFSTGSCNVPNNVTLRGQGVDANGNWNTVLKTTDTSFTNVGLNLCGAASVSLISLDGFGMGIDVAAATGGPNLFAELIDVRNTNNGIFVASNGQVQLDISEATQSTFSGNEVAIFVNSDLAFADVHSALFQANDNAARVNAGTLQMLGTDVTAPGSSGITVSGTGNLLVEHGNNGGGIAIFAGNPIFGLIDVSDTSGQVTVHNASFAGNAGSPAIEITSASANVNVTTSQFDQGQTGIDLAAPAGSSTRLVVSSSTFSALQKGIVVGGQPSAVNLSTTAGVQNHFDNNGVSLEVNVTNNIVVNAAGNLWTPPDGAGNFTDADAAGNILKPFSVGGTQYIDSSGLTTQPFVWSGTPKYNYRLISGLIQF